MASMHLNAGIQLIGLMFMIAGSAQAEEIPLKTETTRWPPHHVIDEAAAAEALAECRSTWDGAEDWMQRRDHIRNHLSTVMELDLESPRPPVPASMHHRREMNGYSVSNLLLETAPGLYVAANLYEPLELSGPHPVVLCPHGHFRGRDDNPEGRFQHDYQRLCAHLARMGAIVITWDMVGWGESTWLPHRVPTTTTLQTWNSVRIIDWLTSRDVVDSSRIAMTGSSGGGTQTFLAAALDERITVSIPVVMVSAHWFGGCACESGLPLHQGSDLRTNNVEFAACAAPRPLLLISCGGDWTSNTPRVEFPYIHSIYEAMGKPEACGNVHLADEQHDYGPSKRRATYDFLSRSFDLEFPSEGSPDSQFDETDVDILSREDLLAIDPLHPLPENHVIDHEEALLSIKSIFNERE
jgi:hypothetical protein